MSRRLLLTCNAIFFEVGDTVISFESGDSTIFCEAGDTEIWHEAADTVIYFGLKCRQYFAICIHIPMRLVILV